MFLHEQKTFSKTMNDSIQKSLNTIQSEIFDARRNITDGQNLIINNELFIIFNTQNIEILHALKDNFSSQSKRGIASPPGTRIPPSRAVYKY